MYKQLKKALFSVYNYIKERYSLKSILSFVLVGVAVSLVVLYLILDYFVFNSLILTFIQVSIPFSVCFLSVAILVLALLGIQDREKNSIFSYLALIGSTVPFAFLWYQNHVFVFLAMGIGISTVIVMTYQIVQKIIVWGSGIGLVSYMTILVVVNGKDIVEALTKLALIPLLIVGLFSDDVSLTWTKEQAYSETLKMKVPKEVKNLTMEDNSDYMMWGTYIGFSFTYKAEATYFKELEEKIQEVPCNDLSYSFIVCYEGTVGEYYHRIKYDSKGKMVYHRVSNNRDY